MYEKICPNCKTTLSSFYNTGMLGCPNCYKAFEKEIELALKKIQGRTFHVGKKPTLDELERELLLEYELLLKEKQKANMEGRFADMLRITDELLELKEELKRRGLK